MSCFISILAPLAGRDNNSGNFASHRVGFQSSRPLRGATITPFTGSVPIILFQSSRPLRGATFNVGDIVPFYVISILAPLAGRDVVTTAVGLMDRDFNPRAPCGARRQGVTDSACGRNFNPRAPCGARQQKYTKIACVFAITDKGQMLFPRQAPPVRTLFEGAGGNRNDTRCEPSRKYRMLALRTTGSSAPLEGMFVCSQSVRSYSHTFSRDNKTEGCPFLHP